MAKKTEQIVLEAESSEEAETRIGEEIKGGDTPMEVASVAAPGKVFIYDTKTGERSRIPRYMLSRKLENVRNDGSRVFTTEDPGVVMGGYQIKCYLHPDDPNRDHYDGLGFPVCRKANLRDPYNRELHMKKRHPQEWGAIQQEAETQKRDEDRELNRRLLNKLVEGG